MAGVLSSRAPSPVEMLRCLFSSPLDPCDLALHSDDLQAKLMEVAATSGPILGQVSRPGHLPVGWLCGSCRAGSHPQTPLTWEGGGHPDGCGLLLPDPVGEQQPPGSPYSWPLQLFSWAWLPQALLLHLHLPLPPPGALSALLLGRERGMRSGWQSPSCTPSIPGPTPSLTHQGQEAADGAHRPGLPVLPPALPSILPRARPVPAGGSTAG